MNSERPILKARIVQVALVAAGLLAGYWLAASLAGGDPQRHEVSEAATEKSAKAPAGRNQMYTCSMHPQVRSTTPGQCPICGMDLIPVPSDEQEEEEGESPRLRLTPRSAALMQIEVWPVERQSVQVPVRLFGRLDHDETQLRTIAAWVPGRLDKLHVDFTGVAVRQGQPMVQLYSPKLIAAQEELLQALQADRELEAEGVGIVRETTRLTVVASRDRLRLLGLDSAQIERMEKRGEVEDYVTIPAPVSGIVIERLASVGDYVDTGTPIYRLADLSRLWAQLEVYESDLQRLEIGQQVSLSTQSLQGQSFEGTVSFIDPTLNDRTRTARVRVDVANADGRLKPGMFVRGTVAGGTDRTADVAPHAAHATPGDGVNQRGPEKPTEGSAAELLIPASAPLITGRRAVVYVQLAGSEQPTFEPRDVLLGPRAGAWYVVREGLAEGDLVVAKGAFKIDSELQIRGQPSMMQPEGGAAPVHDHGATGGPAEKPARPGRGAGEPAPAGRGADAAPVVAATEAPEGFRSNLGRLVRSQFALVGALANDDAEAARRTALDVDKTLHAVDGTQLLGPNARGTWNRQAKAMHLALGGLGVAPGLEGQRRHFETFSDALTEAVQAFGIDAANPVYRAMCPMVQGRDGYWLQGDEVIANPYFGTAMKDCGAIVETLSDDAPHDGHGS
jgi:Cu(I)/Ag(I) efflux system membrane fusion protein